MRMARFLQSQIFKGAMKYAQFLLRGAAAATRGGEVV